MGLTQVNSSSHLGQSYHVGRNISIFSSVNFSSDEILDFRIILWFSNFGFISSFCIYGFNFLLCHLIEFLCHIQLKFFNFILDGVVYVIL